MKTIWKFPIRIESSFKFDPPFGAQLLHVGLDGSNVPCVWALVNPAATPEERELIVVGTGFDLPANAGNYLGTFTQGPYVWHVFDSHF